ncbi:hypothetical protein [Acidisphaera rubrifaciens]|uniref:Uncharacterized protein n=1 Tax=Acidisphaera rubrifaciens HS-AP3 TaxID=1231350 RepID=A0A0D6PBL0_9PROT|nr:hypothetical protein [Acidisphaera rubrifaciens]GAN78244.1 hypothetical protein Asru_0705_04 [Acidisphaera rubrifaciens HS-AP3]
MRMILLLAVLALSPPVDAMRTQAGADPVVRVADHLLTVANRARQPIIAVRMSSARDDDWGDDRLGPQQTIAPGRSVTLHLQGAGCAWDAQATYRDGSTQERRGLDICRVRTVAFDGGRAGDGDEDGGGQDQPGHDVSLRNASGRTITEIYVSPRNATDWGDDRLGDGQLLPGKALSVTFNGGCRQDVRIVYDNKSAEERRGVDLCAHPRLRISPGWVLPDQPGMALPHHGDGSDDQGSGDQPDDKGQGDKAPGDQGPGDQGPGDQGPGDQAPGDQTPGDQGPDNAAPGNGGQHIRVILPQGSVLRLTC